MSLRDLLGRHEDELAHRWLEAILATYSADAARFFRREKDAFANPVGQTLARETRAALRALLGEQRDALQAALEPLIKIRSVQGFKASEAVSIIYLLKDILRSAVLREALPWASSPDTAPPPDAGQRALELLQLESELDGVALQGLDIYMTCRDTLHALRIAELKRSVHTLLRRAHCSLDEVPRGTP